MKIVLCRPNYKSYIIDPPLGLGYLASFLKAHNIDSIIIDGLRDRLSIDALVKKIIIEKPDAVGITCLTSFYKEAVSLSRKIKKNGIKCLLGGIHPTFLPYETLIDSSADYVICGEAEIPLLELVKNNFINDNIPGVYSKANIYNVSLNGSKGEIIKDLDRLPFPDWEQINPRNYPMAPHGAVAKKYPIGLIITSRGCPFECVFCASPKFHDHKIRFRSPINVIQEIEYLISNFGVKEIHFEDDNLTLNYKNIEEICNLIIKKELKIKWACPNGIRADSIDEKLIKLMKKSGCYHVALGIESANSAILNKIKKKESLEIIKKSIGTLAKHNIVSQGFFIFGLPGETEETISETIKFAKRVPLMRALFLILEIFPGSELWYALSKKNRSFRVKESENDLEWIPNNLTFEKLIKAQKKAFFQFYLRPKILWNFVKYFRPIQMRFFIERLRDYHLLK